VKTIANRELSVFSIGLLAATVVGLALGSAFPKRVHAADYWQIWFDVPVGGTTGDDVTLTCGWHGECETPTSGNALDWDPPTSAQSAYFAGAAKYDGGGLTKAADVEVKDEPLYQSSLCKNVVARVWKLSENILSRQVYTHVELDDDFDFPVYADSSPLGFRRDVGEAQFPEDELENCPIDEEGDPHVHNYPQLVDSINWDGFPDSDDCFEQTDSACQNPRTNHQWVHWVDWFQ
jgi:hypothetical protein